MFTHNLLILCSIEEFSPSSVTGCNDLLIITDDEKDTLQISGKRINVMPAWEWLLGKDQIL